MDMTQLESAFRSLFRLIYYLPWSVALLLPAVILLLRGADLFLRRREEEAARREERICLMLFFIWIGIAACFTLLFRTGKTTDAVLDAFAAVRKFLEKRNPEVLRAFLMNILLFIPGGVFLSGALRDRDPERPFVSALRRTAVTVGVCLVLSALTEISQLVFQLGRFETDDLIANGRGGFLGACPVLVSGLFRGFLGWRTENRFFAKLVELANRHWHIVSYIFWGGTTTFVNWLVFFPLKDRIQYLAANVIAWVISVTFSFLANRAFVFRSGSRGWVILKEGLVFAASRLFSLGLETGLMWAGVELLRFPKGLVKVVLAVSIAVLNFLVGKFVVFRKKTESEYEDF